MKLSSKHLGLYSKLVLKLKKQELIIDRASLSADSSIIDIRFHLTRPDKTEINPAIYLIDEESLISLETTRATRNSRMQISQKSNGILLFYNKNKIIKHGSLVTLVYGYLRVEHIVII